MAGFEGWISIFEDDWLEGTAHSNPQALFVDQENLSFDKTIEYQERIGSSRVGLSAHLISKDKKPKGGFTYEFRSADILKVLMSHFQNGTQSGTRYAFYPRTNTLDYNFRGTYPNQAYGRVTAQPYTVSVLKKMFNTSLDGGTNSFFFKHGVCDQLGFRLKVGEDAKATPNFVFRDLDYGTAVANNPNDGTVGSYSSGASFQFWSATAYMNGAAFELNSFEIQSDQGIQEYSRVGRQDPENYQFAGYRCTGNLTFDLPYDALKHTGSMLGTRSFALVATLYNGVGDQVVFDLPHCVRLPFDYQFGDGKSHINGKIPFQAFESNGTYPIKVTVDAQYAWPGLLVLDAVLGARTVGTMDVYDASSSSRTLNSFNIYSRV